MKSSELFDKRQSFFLEAPAALKGAITAGILIGLASFAWGLSSGQETRTWGAFLFNLFMFFSLGVAGMIIATIQDVVSAKWGRPMRRIHEGFGSFVPVAAVLFTLYIVAVWFDIAGAQGVYKWVANPSMLDHFWGKKTWLQPVPMYLRNIAILAILVLVIGWQLKLSTKRDAAFLQANDDNYKNIANETNTKLTFWASPILVIYGVALTFFAFDILMSLSPLWFSTLWGGWIFASAMHTMVAATLIVMFIFSLCKLNPAQALSRDNFHDVGKLMHGFTIFFAYLTYAHVLTYWYGNVPEETEYFLHRFHEPWINILFIVPIIGFVIPLYTLVFKAAKWTPSITIPLCLGIITAQWLVNMLVVMPEVIADPHAAAGFPVLEIGMFFGVLSIFVAQFMWFAKRNPMLPVGDPLFAKYLDEQGHH